MKITEIRIKLMEGSEDRLRAFCSITIDDSFVVRDLKIIDGTNGPFVAMPSRKLTGHCGKCNHKNHLRATYCNHCGTKLKSSSDSNYDAPQKLYADVAHPINSECREEIQSVVINEFQAELQRASQPGYRSRYDDDFVDVDDDTLDLPSQADDASAGSASSAKSPSGEKPGPPRPHFLDPSKDQGSTATSGSRGGQRSNDKRSGDSDDHGDSFGAGIF
ncbi:septation protein SpoVG family protein [Rubripirellula amarantea]|uniref:septation protein SpoVG family protein n=1 Tax=Rubripirellula amarantea TaxID=2527999 RepID=UPI0011B3F41B|nr:septation protein SpoVG family protein [Rubripirellula amarantea]